MAHGFGSIARVVALAILLIWAGAVRAAPVFTVGVQDYENYLPYSEYKNGEYRGLGRAILDAFAKDNGYIFQYEVYPLKRRDQLLVKDKLDFAFPDNPYWISDQKKGLKVTYAPILEFTDGMLVRPADLGKDVSRIKTLGMPLGFTPYPYMKYVQAGQINIDESPQYDKLYEKLIAGRVDGAYMNVRVANYYWSKIQKWDESPVRFDENLPHVTDFHYLSSTKHPEVIEEFKKFMKENKALIDDLKKQYQFQ
jgi:hypothetical protein